MFAGAPLPLPPDLPLSYLLALSSEPDPLGAWISTCSHRIRVYRLAQPTLGQVLASEDLGYLLRHCTRLALRQDGQVRVLSAESVIYWRALQVVTATPYLPAIDRMRALFPDLRVIAGGFRVPLHAESPEEVLARCVSEGVRVTGSSVVYGVGNGEGVLPVVRRPP